MNDDAAMEAAIDEIPLLVLRGTELRYALVRLAELIGPASVPELIAGLHRWGFTVDGRPSKTISDALRWERRRGRVSRWGRGYYNAGEMPRGTEHPDHPAGRGNARAGSVVVARRRAKVLLVRERRRSVVTATLT